MSQIYLFQDPDQQSVLPAGLREWLPDDDLAYFISEVVEQMDPRFREGRLCGDGSLGSAVPAGCWTTASASGPLGRPCRPECPARRPPAVRPPGQRPPGVVPPLDPIGRGPRPETVAGRWCVPCEKVLGSHAGLGALGHSGEQVGHEVGAAALPTGTGEHRGDGVLQPPCFRRGRFWWASEVTTSTSLSPRAVSKRRRASQRGLAQKTLHHFSQIKAPSRESRRRQALNLPWPTLVRGRRGGSAWPGGLRFGRRGYSEHRMLLVAGLSLHCTAPSSAAEVCGADEGDNIPTLNSDDQFSTMPALMAAPRWRVEWSGSLSFPGCWSGPP